MLHFLKVFCRAQRDQDLRLPGKPTARSRLVGLFLVPAGIQTSFLYLPFSSVWHQSTEKTSETLKLGLNDEFKMI